MRSCSRQTCSVESSRRITLRSPSSMSTPTMCDRPGVLAVRRLPAGQVRCARLRGDHLYGAGTGTSSRGPLRQSRGPARRPLICAAKCLSQSRLEQGAVVGVVGGGRDSAPRPLARCDHLDGYLRQTEPFRSPPYIPVKDEAPADHQIYRGFLPWAVGRTCPGAYRGGVPRRDFLWRASNFPVEPSRRVLHPQCLSPSRLDQYSRGRGTAAVDSRRCLRLSTGRSRSPAGTLDGEFLPMLVLRWASVAHR